MVLLIIYLLIALLVSFFCSIAEATLLSVRPSYIMLLESQKKRGAQKLNMLCNNLDRPLAAILTANTIAHTVGAAGVGAQATVVFGNEYLGITSAVLTLLILVFSEIIPKTIGATYWQQLAPTFAFLIYGLLKCLLPFVWLSEKLTYMISRSKDNVYTFSKDEMKAMALIGAKEGLLDEKELRILNNLMQFNNLFIREIMTPRSVIFSVPENMTVKEYFSLYEHKAFSRIPVYGESRDDVTGFVLRGDLLLSQAKDQFHKSLKDFSRKFLVIPNNIKVSKAFDQILREKSHIALVVDEYGSVQGIVTLEDIIETLLGLEIVDEYDEIEDLRKHALDLWKKRMESRGIDPDSLTNSEG